MLCHDTASIPTEFWPVCGNHTFVCGWILVEAMKDRDWNDTPIHNLVLFLLLVFRFGSLHLFLRRIFNVGS